MAKKYTVRETDFGGFAVVVDDNEVKHLIGIYEPHNAVINVNRGYILFVGHEEIIHLWLDNNSIEKFTTR